MAFYMKEVKSRTKCDDRSSLVTLRLIEKPTLLLFIHQQ